MEFIGQVVYQRKYFGKLWCHRPLPHKKESSKELIHNLLVWKIALDEISFQGQANEG